MLNFIRASFIVLVSLLKKLVIWGSKPQSWKTIVTQLELIKLGAKHLGVATKFKPFIDVADKSISIAKTIEDITNGFDNEARDEFIKAVNKDEGKLKGLSVGLNAKSGIGVSFGGLTGYYNPKDGSARVGVTL